MYFICKKADRQETAPEKDHRDGTAAAGSTCSPTAPHGVLGGTVGGMPRRMRARDRRASGGGVPSLWSFSGACNPVQPCYIIL